MKFLLVITFWSWNCLFEKYMATTFVFILTGSWDNEAIDVQERESSWKCLGKLISRLFVEVVRFLYLKFVMGQANNLRTVARWVVWPMDLLLTERFSMFHTIKQQQCVVFLNFRFYWINYYLQKSLNPIRELS